MKFVKFISTINRTFISFDEEIESSKQAQSIYQRIYGSLTEEKNEQRDSTSKVKSFGIHKFSANAVKRVLKLSLRSTIKLSSSTRELQSSFSEN